MTSDITRAIRPPIGSMPEYKCIKCSDIKPAGSFSSTSLKRSFYICKPCANQMSTDACNRDISRRITQRLKSRKTPLRVDAVRRLLQEYSAESDANKFAVENDNVDIRKIRADEPLNAEGNAMVVPRSEASKRRKTGVSHAD